MRLSLIGDLPAITLLGILCIPCTAFSIEPIGTVGQPYPEQHAFLSDKALLRAVLTHIQIVHPRTGKVIHEFGKRAASSNVVFSPTATHVAILNYSTDSKTTTVHVWDVNARRQVSEWEIVAWLGVSAFSPAQPLFAASFNDEIHLWNWQTGESVGKMSSERGPGVRFNRRDHAMVFSPDGRYLIVASERPDIELWNVETRRLETHFESDARNSVEDVVISPDGTRIASFHYDAEFVYVWDVETRHLLWKKRGGVGRISGVAFSPDSQRLYVANETGVLHARGSLAGPDDPYWEGWDDKVRVRDVESGELVDTFGAEFYRLSAIKLSPDEKTAILHYNDAIVQWDIDAKQALNVWTDFPSGIVDLSPDGQTAISVSRYFIKSWDLASRKMRLLISADGGLFREFAISPDGKRLAIGKDPWIKVYNLRTGEVETQFPYHHGHSDIAFSSSGKWLAAQGDRGGIRIFDTENPEKIPTDVPDGDDRWTWKRGITFSENDRYLAAVDSDDQAVLWIREEDTFVFQYAWQVQDLSPISNPSFVFGVDGSAFLAVPGRERLQIWQLMSHGTELAATLDVESPAHFRPDGRYLYVNRNKRLQIWDWQAKTPIEHLSIPEYFAISRNGTVLLSYNDNSWRIEVWDGRALLPIESLGKHIVAWGQVKRNRLLQNYPNPFTPETWIPFQLANESDVTIRIHSVTGQVVRVLSLGKMAVGDYSSQSRAIYWDGHNETGELAGSGIYLYTINAGNFSATRKMLIRK